MRWLDEFRDGSLVPGLRARIARAGLSVHLPRRVPANDGGLALGQAAVYASTCG